MSLVLPDEFCNVLVTITNNGGGISARNSIALALGVQAPPLDQTAVNAISNIIRDNLKTLWDNQWEVGPTRIYEGFASGPPNVWDDPTEEAGTHSADTYAPPQVCHVVKKSTGIAGRRHRGRVFLPGVPDGFAGEDGGLNPTRVAEVDAAFLAMYTALNALSSVDGMYLLHDSESPSATDPPNLVLAWKTSATLGTMRPRLRR